MFVKERAQLTETTRRDSVSIRNVEHRGAASALTLSVGDRRVMVHDLGQEAVNCGVTTN